MLNCDVHNYCCLLIKRLKNKLHSCANQEKLSPFFILKFHCYPDRIVLENFEQNRIDFLLAMHTTRFLF